MKPLWARLMAKVEALSLRERVIMFVGVLAILAVLTDALFVSPLTQQQKMLTQSIDRQSEDSESRRDQLLSSLQKRDRERVVSINAELGRLQADIDAVDKEIAKLAASPVDASALPVLLERVLKRTDRVAIVKVTSLKADLPNAATLAGVPVTAPPPASSALDITLAGGYLDVMEYLANLEKSLPSVHWSAVRMVADATPQQFTVRMLLPGGRP